jgi:predicted lipoprotein with Yx(FWY)xxD motif
MNHTHTHRVLFAVALLTAVIALAACGAAATPAPPTASPPTSAPVQAPPTAVPTAVPTLAPTLAPTVAPTAVPTVAPTTASAAITPPAPKPVTLQIVQDAKLGKILADGDGNILYLYTKDTANVSNCYDKCEQTWPVVRPLGQPTLKEGVSAALIGTTQRKDGTNQLTYNTWPVYYYAKDTKPGDTTGQAVGSVWWVYSAEGNPIKAATLQVATDAKLGKILADDAGRTLYMYMKDTKDTTVCYDKCEQSWPPLLALGQTTAKDGVTASLLGTTQRKDGTLHVTYNGMPLYYYAKDAKPGDTTGQSVGTVWFVVAPDGSVVK